MAVSPHSPPIGRVPDRRSLSEVVADEIQEHILSNRLPPGTKLPTEPELMKQFEVSRTVVREAVRGLVQRGLVEVRPRRGMTVAPVSFDALANQLNILLRTAPAAESQLFEVRELVEPAIAALAAVNRTDDDIAVLEAALRSGEANGGDAAACLESDIAFHEALASATQNPFCRLITLPTSALLRRTYSSSFDYHKHQQFTQREHREIFDAVVAGDVSGADEAVRRHLARVRESFKDYLVETYAG